MIARSCVAWARREWVLCLILTVAFVLRIAGIGYGLPLSVVSDEYPFTYAALQMLQSHTLIPALHPELFRSILPYPPYLSYILILPFVAILAGKYVFFHGSAALFSATIASDLSAFFIAARLFSIALGLASIMLTYFIAMRLWKSRVVASAAAFLLATSVLHVALSMVGRNWMPTEFVFLCVLYVLTQDRWSLRARYLAAFGIAAFGMGVSSFCAASVAMVVLYYLMIDMRSLGKAVRNAPFLMGGVALFALLSTIPFLLYRSGGGVFLGGLTLLTAKSIYGLVLSPWSLMSLIAFTEPVLAALSIAGAALLVAYRWREGYFFLAWYVFYAAVFYLLFRFESRFMAPMLPVLAMAGGYSASWLWERCAKWFVMLLFVLPFIVSIQVASLAHGGDTRQLARTWALEHVSPEEKLLVASGSRVPTQAVAVEELRTLDPSAVRKVDEADGTLARQDVPYVLNELTLVGNTDALARLPQHVKDGQYAYAMVEPSALDGLVSLRAAVAEITKGAVVVKEFPGFGSDLSLSESQFSGSLFSLFSPLVMGPGVVIYRLEQK